MRNHPRAQLGRTCHEVINLLTDKVVPKANEGDFEEGVFYRKMIADYYRYIAEFTKGAHHDEAARNATDAYEKASEIAKNLRTTNTVRLGLALNFAVFLYEIV